MDKRYNILYKGNIVHKERTIEECSEILDTAATRFYDGEDIDPNEFDVVEVFDDVNDPYGGH